MSNGFDMPEAHANAQEPRIWPPVALNWFAAFGLLATRRWRIRQFGAGREACISGEVKRGRLNAHVKHMSRWNDAGAARKRQQGERRGRSCAFDGAAIR